MKTEEIYKVGPIAAMPKTLRPYERCEAYGPESLSDMELLAVLLRSGPAGMSCMDLSARLISELGGADGILFLRKVTFEELVKIHGIGRVKALQLLCIGELARRMAKKEAKTRLKLNSPESIADYYMEDLLGAGREQVLVMYLDTKYRLITDRILSTGTVNASLISPREIFMEALKFEAVHIILLHNHPSGDPSPSEEDRKITEQVRRAGEMLGIDLTDHIILGDHCYYSFAQQKEA